VLGIDAKSSVDKLLALFLFAVIGSEVGTFTSVPIFYTYLVEYTKPRIFLGCVTLWAFK
jgi:hypothetical protein